MGRRQKKTLEYKSHKAEDAFAFLRSHANRKDLGYLLELGAGISAIASFAEATKDKLATSCHYQVSRIFLDAVLCSSASSKCTNRPRIEDLSKLVNSAIDVSHDPEALKKTSAASGTDSVRLEFMRFMARLGQVQIAPFDQHPTLNAGRTVGLLEAIPSRHRAQIGEMVAGGSRVLDLPSKEVLGLSVNNAAKVYFLLLQRYADLWRQVNACLPADERRVSEALPVLDNRAIQNYWSFTPRSLTGQSDFFQSEINEFLRLFSRPPACLREISEAPKSPYQLGHFSCRMLPLDRFPVVELENRRFIIPNITIFRSAFPHVMDFSLMDAYRNAGLDDLYNHVRGAALELYLQDLILDRLPSCVLIPETQYRTSRGDKRSPDLCILDPDDQTLIVVEAKGRRLSPGTAVDATDSNLDSNHGPAIKALLELPKKIREIFTAPEFKQWRGPLSRIPRNRAILVSVVAGTLFFHDELEPLRARFDASHLLADLEQPFCFLDLQIFERAVELARSHKIPLGRLLREHYEDTRAGDPNTSAGRQFRNRKEPDPEDTFAWSFLESDVGEPPASPITEPMRQSNNG